MRSWLRGFYQLHTSQFPIPKRKGSVVMKLKHFFAAIAVAGLFFGCSVHAQEKGKEVDAPVAAADEVPKTAEKSPAADDTEKTSPTDDAATTPIETEKDAEKVVGEVAEQVVGQAKDAAAALAAGDVATAADKGLELFTTYGIPAITALIVIILSYFVAAFLARIASRPVRAKVDETLGRFIGKFVFYLVMTAALLGVLQYFGIGISGFAAVLAAAGFAVGLAFQGTLSNFAAGIMLLVFRPFKVGDAINAAGITAKVYEIDLFHTVFDTPDNRRIIVPNSSISGGTIENISHHQERRVDVNVGIEYAASLDQTREVLTAAAETLKDKLIPGESRGYQIALIDLGDSAVNWTVRFWTTSADFWAVKEQLTYAVKTQLDKAGIGIPFPQMDVHLVRTGLAFTYSYVISQSSVRNGLASSPC